MKRRSVLNNTEFRPRLPKDPFGATPWVLDVEHLENASTTLTKSTVLVLGTPPTADLAALLCGSPALAASLIVIATHDVVVVPASWQVQPTVRILKLGGPLFGGATGALGLMSVLDRASRFVSTPQLSSGGKKVQVYVEDPVSKEFTLTEEDADRLSTIDSSGGMATKRSRRTSLKMLKKPSASTLSFLSQPPPTPTADKATKRRTFGFGGAPAVTGTATASGSGSLSSSMASSPASSVLSFLSNNSTTSISGPSAPALPPGRPVALASVPQKTRPFDTLIHYLELPPPVPALPPFIRGNSNSSHSSPTSSPSTSSSSSSLTIPHNSQHHRSDASTSNVLSEKGLLKQAILVTTLSAPYLAVPPELPSHLRRSTTSSRSRVVSSNGQPSNAGLKRLSLTMGGSGSKSVPDGMNGGMLRKRRSTVPEMPPLPIGEEDKHHGERGDGEGSVSASKSVSSLKALKRKLTLRRSSTAPDPLPHPSVDSVPPLPGLPGDHTQNAELSTTPRKKRFSLINLTRSGTFKSSKLDIANGEAGWRRSMIEGDSLDACAEWQAKRLQLYRGRSHILHVLVDPSLDAPGMVIPIKSSKRPPQLAKALEQFLTAFSFPAPINISASLSSLSTSSNGSPPVSPRLGSGSGSPSSSPRLNQGLGPRTNSNPGMDAIGRANAVAGVMAGVPGANENGNTKPVPFVLRSGALGALMRAPNQSTPTPSPAPDGSGARDVMQNKEWSLAECVVFGALDGGEARGVWKAWLDVYAPEGVLINSGQVDLHATSLSPPLGHGHMGRSLGGGGKKVQVRRRGIDELVGGDVVRDDDVDSSEKQQSRAMGIPEVTITGAAPTSSSLLAQTKPRLNPAARSNDYQVPRQSVVPSAAKPMVHPVTPNPTPSPPSSSSGHGSSDSSSGHNANLDAYAVEAQASANVVAPPVSKVTAKPTSHRQPIQIPLEDRNFHLPKHPSGDLLTKAASASSASPSEDAERSEKPLADMRPRPPRQTRPLPHRHAQAYTQAEVDAGMTGGMEQGKGWNDSADEGRETGLLTPPESRSSVSSEEGLLGPATPPPEPKPEAILRSIPATASTTTRAMASLSASDSRVSKSESFDFVGAYMYDRGEVAGDLMRQGSMLAVPPPGQQSGVPRQPNNVVEAQVHQQQYHRHLQHHQHQPKQSLVVAPTFQHQQQPQLQHEQRPSRNSGSMNTRDAQDYANTLRRYREEDSVPSRVRTTSGNVSHSASGTPSVGSGGRRELSMSMDSESVVDGRKEMCSMMGVPPSIGYEDVVVHDEEAGNAQRRRSLGAGVIRGIRKVRSKGELPGPEILEPVPPVASFATSGGGGVDHAHGREKVVPVHGQERESSNASYHYRKNVEKSDMGGGAHLNVPEGGKAQLLKKRSSRFGDFMGRVFSGGSSGVPSAT